MTRRVYFSAGPDLRDDLLPVQALWEQKGSARCSEEHTEGWYRATSPGQALSVWAHGAPGAPGALQGPSSPSPPSPGSSTTQAPTAAGGKFLSDAGRTKGAQQGHNSSKASPLMKGLPGLGEEINPFHSDPFRAQQF